MPTWLQCPSTKSETSDMYHVVARPDVRVIFEEGDKSFFRADKKWYDIPLVYIGLGI